MDQSTNPSNYNETITPSAPINFHQNHGFVQHGFQTQPNSAIGFVNSEFQPDFKEKTGYVPPYHQVYAQPQQQLTANPTVIMPQQQQYINRSGRRNGSTLGGLFLMLNSGLHIAWGLWRVDFEGVWRLFLGMGLLAFMIMAWSVGAFLGGFVGSILTPFIRKNIIYYITGVTMLLGNLILIIWDQDRESIIVARVMVGIAHGITYVALVIQAGENADKSMRGRSLSIINFTLYTGIFLSTIISGTVRISFWGFPDPISGERIIGIVGVLLAVASLACTVTMAVETVPFLLYRNDSGNAMINLKYLRGATHETLLIRQEMDEFNAMVVQDRQKSCNIFTNGNAKPLVLMILMRLMVALTNNFLMNFVTFSFVLPMLYQYRLIPLVAVSPRLFMAIMQLFYGDFFQRKLQMIVSLALAATIIILVGILLNALVIYSFWQLHVVNMALGSLLLVFQFACSIGIDQMQDVYMSEAFSTSKKPWSIAFVSGIEHLFHIFMIGMFFVGETGIAPGVEANAMIFTTGVMIVVFGLILSLLLPETRKVTLKQANDLFVNRTVNFSSPFA